ncbi:hypothetical protein FYK55_16960 [Roseiconus nitratireducens]|uniref:Uncharacterized protein n=1 Tax=Roseiconus nitratireducens TaxID=2605748 RepID=A0A5M6D2Z5_9BACT|nr:hypothetical protein [Roseiconus nitratireducens]KAA5541887.1 hypothetical protein FYK55_16960 [Roseiconus nitratireducens]
MTTLIEKIRSRGSWTIRIRPIEFEAHRVDRLAQLVDAVQTSRVELRGWDFPHIDPNTVPVRMSEYVEQQTDWEQYVELWRAYKSGQFISVSGMSCDWRDQSKTLWPAEPGWRSGTSLSAESSIFRFVEAFEFAAKWTRAVPVGEEMSVSVKVAGLRDRALQLSPDRMASRFNYTSSVDEFTWEEQYSTSAVFSSPRENAVEPATELFELFGLDIDKSFIRDMQAKLLG